MCMGYVAHLITASDFNDIISEQDGNIRGDSLSSTNAQGRELVVSSLQEQLASTSRAHETERQNLQDRITALEIERNELRAHHESDVAQIDDIVRDCQEAHDRRQYWKAQYYDLRDQGDRQDAKTSSTVAVAKKLDKGKGKDVQYSYKAYQVEHYLTDMEDDDSEPEAHPNRLKGKQREVQNKINRETRRQMDAVSAQQAKEEGRSPPPKRSKSSKNKEFDILHGMVTKLPFQDPTSVEEVERIIKTLEESDNWYIAEMNQQGHTVPKLFEPKPSQKKARHAAAGASLHEAGPSNVASTSATTDGEVMADIPTLANGTIIERFPTVLERRVWRGRWENDSVLHRYDGILQSMGLLPHRSFRPGPLPDYSRASPPTVRQIAHKLAIRGYTTAQLQDLALYLLWWLYGVAASMTTRWVVIQHQFIHVVNDVLAHHVFQGVPHTTIEVENYIFTDGSQSGNLGNAGRFADYSVVLTYVRPIAQQLSLPTTGQSAASITTDDVHLGSEPPSIVDWDDTQFNAEGDPVIDYGEDDGMNMAG
ncbi:hypothetical protein F5890DRAFT_1589371 [Lentinula detonsa]|uniref:Uncharacterized protein n=1 Tax=Lentinula detonsa TaxID=2804962 RepID=A0AA38PQK0_9AGAR|nr:hypothetical protein F5890DRAFT_1589371 [Lentinula detonsa]